ncbi:hypothetical protein J1605_007597 [Eschrichtius robustus]|uniref:Uncharacterized protein n=1 Tax=Eschrichtius robustus TaxID=9764 RepID=A0AB34H023_ESCRO|nr:hypothetical protein J1605_007597 [Eschrichtius robustus]
MGFSLQRPLLLQSTSSRCLGFSSCDTRVSATLARGLQSASSAAVVYGLSCSVARGILPDQGSNPCTLHWQADSQPLRHQGSPEPELFLKVKNAPLPFSIVFFPDNDDDEKYDDENNSYGTHCYRIGWTDPHLGPGPGQNPLPLRVCQFVVSVNGLNVLHVDYRTVSNLILTGPRTIVMEVMEELEC